MRVLTYRANGGARVGVRTPAGVVDAGYARMIDLIRDGEAGIARVRELAAAPGAEIVVPERVLAPLRPGKIFGGGLNFASHTIEEPGARFPQEPRFFSQFPSSVVGPGDDIVLPFKGMHVDYEVEVCFVLGRDVKDATADTALDAIFGWTLCNDVGSRIVQFKDTQETLGKNVDTFFPLGPEIVLRDEVSDETGLHLEAHVNGELRQSESAGNARWKAAEMIEWLSSILTLEAGDLVSTGTPAGCGTFMNPPVWLEPGDVVTVSERVTGLSMTNAVVAGPRYETEWEEHAARFRREEG